MTLLKLSRNNTGALDEATMRRVLAKAKAVVLALLGRTSRRMQIASGLIAFVFLAIYLAYPTLQSVDLPTVALDYEHYAEQAAKFNVTKVGLLIENRPFPILAPLMLHFMSVMPPDWRFRFMGSIESVAHINKSMAIREQVMAGKLDLTYIPSNMSTGSQEEISRFLTNLWLYEVVLQPAEWLLVFQTDSILCANSRQNLNDYLGYDWVGAPWNPKGRFGGNGGLSLRRVSAIIDVLRNQQRVDGTEPEDVWLTERLGHRPGAKLANGTVSSTFSGEMHSGDETKLDIAGTDGIGSGHKELNDSTLAAAEHGEYVAGIDDWRNGFYEPMGYHTGGSGKTLHGSIWGSPEKRKHIWDYCPEVKMTLKMDVAKFVPGNCRNNWKRWETADEGGEGDDTGATNPNDLGYGTEIIDGQEYPLLPENLVAW